MAKGAFRNLRKKVDYSEYGGAPLLGVSGACLIGHGKSSAKAIRNAIHFADSYAASGVIEKIGDTILEVLAGPSGAGELRSIAALFPGQGSQAVGMGRDLAERWPASAGVFEMIDSGLEHTAFRALLERSRGRSAADREHPARAARSLGIAAWEVLSAAGLEVGAVAGHSLGEYSAVVAAERSRSWPTPPARSGCADASCSRRCRLVKGRWRR